MTPVRRQSMRIPFSAVRDENCQIGFFYYLNVHLYVHTDYENGPGNTFQ